MSHALAPNQKSVFLVPNERAIEFTRTCAEAIRRAATIAEVRCAMTQAEAVSALVHALDVNEKIKRDAEFLRMRAERRLGEITRQIPSGDRARPKTSLAQHNEILRLAKEGMSHPDIARRVGVHTSTVFARVHGTLKPPAETPSRTKAEILADYGLSPNMAHDAEQLARVPTDAFESALEKEPNRTRAREAMGIRQYYSVIPKAFRALAEDAMALLRSCCAEGRAPLLEEVGSLEDRLVRCNVQRRGAQ